MVADTPAEPIVAMKLGFRFEVWALLLAAADGYRIDKEPARGAGAVRAHADFFQDFFSVQLAPHKLEFGHVCENPDEWEQRYERKDLKNRRDQGKVRWGDRRGGYGEHYWDLNHAGHQDDGADDQD